MPKLHIAIQTADFDVSAELAALRAGDHGVGAVCCFVGTVRDRNAGDAAGTVAAMELEHYPGMTEKSIEAMAQACGVLAVMSQGSSERRENRDLAAMKRFLWCGLSAV